MGQKISPTGLRVGINRTWDSRWFANSADFSKMLNQDIQARDYLKAKLERAMVSKIIIERPARNARITIHTARPGVVIGKKGEDLDVLRGHVQKILGVPVHLNVEEVRRPEVDAQLVAESIANQLVKRIMFRRAMKRAMTTAMRMGAQGIRIECSGRLNGIEIARTEWYREGRVPLHTLRADIDYATAVAKTTYGVIGIKVWVYKGDIIGNEAAAQAPAPEPAERKPRREGRGEGGGGREGERPGGRPRRGGGGGRGGRTTGQPGR